MKKYLVIVLALTCYSQADAASVKGKIDSQATSQEISEAKAETEKATGRAATVVRDENGKVEAVVVNLPDHDNAGIQRASEALLNSNGVSAVEVVKVPDPDPTPTPTPTPELSPFSRHMLTVLTTTDAGLGDTDTALANINVGYAHVERLSPSTNVRAMRILDHAASVRASGGEDGGIPGSIAINYYSFGAYGSDVGDQELLSWIRSFEQELSGAEQYLGLSSSGGGSGGGSGGDLSRFSSLMSDVLYSEDMGLGDNETALANINVGYTHVERLNPDVNSRAMRILEHAASVRASGGEDGGIPGSIAINYYSFGAYGDEVGDQELLSWIQGFEQELSGAEQYLGL